MKIPALLVAVGLLLIPAPAAQATEDQQPALEVLDQITVAEDHHMGDYDRDLFAPNGWIDTTGSGCHTREDILTRDLDPDSLVTQGCTVEYGTTMGPYSGKTIEHVLGESQVDVEHTVAVGQAWRNGAHAWDREQMETFYQDPENLIAVSAAENQAKLAGDITEYIPPNTAIHCEFAAAKIYIKDKYALTMTADEHTVIHQTLTTSDCADTVAAPAHAMTTTDPDTGQDQPESSHSWIEDALGGQGPWMWPLILIVGGVAAVVLVKLRSLLGLR